MKSKCPPIGIFWRRPWLESVSELQTDSSPRSSVRDWSSPGFTVSDTVSVVWRRLRAELGVEMSVCVWESRVSQRQKSCGNENQRGSMSLTVKSLRCLWRGRRCLSSRAGAMNVFDRSMKRRQKQWASSLPDSDKYDYLRDEVRRCITARLCLGGPRLCEWTSACLCLGGPRLCEWTSACLCLGAPRLCEWTSACLCLGAPRLCEWTSALVVFAGGEQVSRQSVWCLKVTARLLHTFKHPDMSS